MASVLLFMALASSSHAQPEALTTLSGQLELARIVDLAAERLGINVEYDAARLQGAVTLRLGSGVTDDELWALTNRLLASRGFATIRRSSGATVSVVALSEAAEAARVESVGVAPNASAPAGYRTQIVRIEHASTAKVLDALQPLLGKSGKVSRIGTSDRLLVSATAEQHDLIARLLKDLDAPDTAATIEEITVHNSDVDRLMALVEQMQASDELVSGRRLPGRLVRAPDGVSVLVIAPKSKLPEWRELIHQLDRREPVMTRGYTPRHFGLEEVRSLIESTIAPKAHADERWRIVIDALTGSLIVTATASEHEAVAALLERLGDAPAGTLRPVRSWVMKNRAVDEVISVLEGLISAGVLDAPGPSKTPQAMNELGTGSSPLLPDPPPPDGRGEAPRSPANTLPRSDIAGGGGLTLTADVGTNTLIAVGPPRMLDQIQTLLATIDVRQPQVMIEVLMIGLTDAETRDLAIQLEQIVSSSGTLVRLASLFGLPGIADRTATSALAGTGGTAVVLDPGDFGVLVRALETVNEGRTLSMPRVLATNNIAASFNSTVNEPYLSTNASDTVATTSFGGSESAGTQITITPQIASGDHLVLEYEVTLSAFLGESADPSLPPARQQNMVSSTATIPDGYTVAVGGFEFTSEGKSTNQVPLIAKIPLLGELFKSRSASNTRTRFYVFIRANVLRSGGFDDLMYISDQWAREASVEAGWPTVEPRVIK